MYYYKTTQIYLDRVEVKWHLPWWVLPWVLDTIVYLYLQDHRLIIEFPNIAGYSFFRLYRYCFFYGFMSHRAVLTISLKPSNLLLWCIYESLLFNFVPFWNLVDYLSQARLKRIVCLPSFDPEFVSRIDWLGLLFILVRVSVVPGPHCFFIQTWSQEK